jgi:hypothetical protein
MIAEYHGPFDHYYFYAYAKVLDILNIPISMYTLNMGNVILSLLCVVMFYIVGKVYFNSAVGLIAALLLSLNVVEIDQSVFISRYSGLITITVCVFLVSLRYLMEKKNTLWTVIVAIVILFASTGELIMTVPLLYVVGVVFLLIYETPERLTLGDIVRFLVRRRSIMLLCLSIPMLIGHYYLSERIIGLFGPLLGPDYKARHFFDQEFFTMLLSFLSAGGSVLFAVLVWCMFIYLIVKEKSKSKYLIAMYAAITLILGIEFSIMEKPQYFWLHLYYTTMPFCVFSAATIYYFIKHIGLKQKGYLYQYAGAVILIAAFSPQIVEVIEDYKKHPAYKPSALAPVGWYIRKYGEKYTSKVYNLFDDVTLLGDKKPKYYYGDNRANYHYGTPLWYGKQIGKDFKKGGSLHPVEHYRRAIYGYSEIFFSKLPDRYDINKYPFKFDFVVVVPEFLVKEAVREFAVRNLEALQRDGYRVVAVVKDEGSVVAKIYSYKELPYVEMDLSTYSQKWDDEYGNLSNLFEHNRIGLSMEMGYIEHLEKWEYGRLKKGEMPEMRFKTED